MDLAHISDTEIIELCLKKDYDIILKYFELVLPSGQEDYSHYRGYHHDELEQIMSHLFRLDKTNVIVTLSEHLCESYVMDKIISFNSEKILQLVLEKNPNFIKNTNQFAEERPYESVGIRIAYSNKLNLLKICLENGYGPNDAFIQLILTNAIVGNNPTMVAYLLESGTDAQYIFDKIMSENDLAELIGKYIFGFEMILVLEKSDIDIIKYINKLNIIAIGHANLDFVKYCVQNGADPTYENNYPIKEACKMRSPDISAFLLEFGADINSIEITDLSEVFCSWSGDDGLSYMKFLIANGFDYVEKINLLFLESVASANCSLLSYFVELGADIHARDDLALFIAAYDEYADVLDILLDLGADIHAQNDSIISVITDLIDPFDIENNYYFYRLDSGEFHIYDIGSRGRCILKKLIKHGAAISDPRILSAVLADFTFGADIEIVAHILSMGIDINEKHKVKLCRLCEDNVMCILSPLEASICTGQNIIAEFLIQNGAAYDNALGLAIKYENLAIIELLLELGLEVDFEYDTSEKILDLLAKHGIEKKLII